MKTIRYRRLFTVAFGCFILLADRAESAVIFNISEVGGNVVMSYSGSLDLTGTSHIDSSRNPGGGQAIAPAISSFVSGTSAEMDIYRHTGDLGITAFGVGETQIHADSSFGDLFACMVFNGSSYNLFLPRGYVSGTNLSGSATWNNTTIAELGLFPGSSHTFTLPNDSFTINIASSIPEPSTITFITLGAAAGLLIRYRRPRN